MLYGDNAYVNDMYMAIPYPNTLAGPKDAYNYFHLQVIFSYIFGVPNAVVIVVVSATL